LLNFPISNGYLFSFPQNLNQAEFLECSIILSIKTKSAEILFKIYEKYSYKLKVNKKDKNAFSDLISNKYSFKIFDSFVYLLSISNDKNIPEKILCYIYEFFSLILIRKEKYLISYLESNIQTIIKNYIIYNNKKCFRSQYDFLEVILHKKFFKKFLI